MRYFYSDPIVAAYMVKHHGIKVDQFRVQHPDDMLLAGARHIGNNVFIGWTGQRKFFVQNDSVLSPQQDDQGMLDDGRVVYFNALSSTWWWHQGAKQPIFINKPVENIFMRGGKPFFFPESEEA